MAKRPQQPFLIVEPPGHWLEIRLAELWQYRDLLLTLAWRDIQVRYKQTLLGMTWAVVQPLAGMVIFTVIFARMAHLPTDAHPAPLFYYTGLLAWTFFSQTVSGASQSLIEGSRLITKVYFPRIMIPASVLGYTSADLLLSCLLLIPFMVFYATSPGIGLLLLPLALLFLGLVSLGVGLIIAALNVKYRDFRYVVPFLLQLWMFATPVVYPTSLIPERWRILAGLNPMTGVVALWRGCLLDSWPSPSILIPGLLVGLVVAVAGLAYFRRAEDEMADIL